MFKYIALADIRGDFHILTIDTQAPDKPGTKRSFIDEKGNQHPDLRDGKKAAAFAAVVLAERESEKARERFDRAMRVLANAKRLWESLPNDQLDII